MFCNFKMLQLTILEFLKYEITDHSIFNNSVLKVCNLKDFFRKSSILKAYSGKFFSFNDLQSKHFNCECLK